MKRFLAFLFVVFVVAAFMRQCDIMTAMEAEATQTREAADAAYYHLHPRPKSH